MIETIGEPFQIRRLERIIGRKLHEVERKGILPIKYKQGNRIIYERIKQHNFKDFYSKVGI